MSKQALTTVEKSPLENISSGHHMTHINASHIRELFEQDPLISKALKQKTIPEDIPEIMEGLNRGMAVNGKLAELLASFPKVYNHMAEIIQKQFFPNAKELTEGASIMAAFNPLGGPPPAYIIRAALAKRMVEHAQQQGFHVDVKPI